MRQAVGELKLLVTSRCVGHLLLGRLQLVAQLGHLGGRLGGARVALLQGERGGVVGAYELLLEAVGMDVGDG